MREEENMGVEDRAGPPEGPVSAFVQIAELLPHGVILCDLRGRVLFANRIAEAVLAQGDALLLDRSGELRGRVPAETAVLRHAFAEGGAVRASRAGGETLPLLVCPLPPTGAVVFIGDHEASLNNARQSIARWYGLTPSEAKLAAALAEGESLEEAAELMGITRNTARTHLKRIFAKTGTNRQGALVRLLLTGPATLRSR
jgi:DNA-binding CsgD family transcriptional regulator